MAGAGVGEGGSRNYKWINYFRLGRLILICKWLASVRNAGNDQTDPHTYTHTHTCATGVLRTAQVRGPHYALLW